MGSSDAELIGRSARDPAAFGELFDRHYPAVHRYAVARLGRDEGEEVAAQTFLVALEHRAHYDLTRTDARPWLFGIATNLIRRSHRQRARAYRATARLRGGTAVVVDDMARVDALQDARPVATALAHLPAGDRDVLLLFAWADLAYDQIADALSIPVGTVRSRLHRARASLRSELVPVTGGGA